MGDTTPDDLDVIFPGLTNVLHSSDWTPQGSDHLQADAEHGGVTDESLAEFVRARMSQGQPFLPPVATTGGGQTTPTVVDETPPPSEDDPSEEEGEPAVPVPPDAEPSPSEPAAPAPSDGEAPPAAIVPPVTDEPTAEQLASWRAFQDAINPLSPNFNPAFRQLVTDFYLGRTNAVAPAAAGPAVGTPAAADIPAAAPAAPPPLTDDYTDPAVVALQQELARLRAQVEAQHQTVAQASQAVYARAEADTRAIVESAVTQFKTDNSLGDADIARLRLFASNTRLIDPWMSGVNPETGAPLAPDLALATRKALEAAMYADPQIRERKIREAMNADVDRQRKRQRLAGIGGAGGSVSRAPAPPALGTPESHRQMVAEVGAMLSGSWTDPGA